MTVASDVQDVTYATDGATVVFPIPYYFLRNGDVRADRIDASGAAVPLVFGTDFSLAGAGNPAGGALTTFDAIAAGYTLHIYRDVPATQETQYQQNDPFPSKTTERALDKLTMLIQRAFGLIATGVRYPFSEFGMNAVLPTASKRARKALVFKSNGEVGVSQQDWREPQAILDEAKRIAEQITAGAQGALGTFIQDGPGSVALTFQQKMRENIGIGDKGPLNANSFDDDTTPVNNAIATAPVGGVVNLAGKSMRVTGVDNQYGIEFEGGGELLIAAPQGGVYAQNSYGDRFQRFIGKEYLYRLFLRLQVGGTLSMFIYGDSTAATAGNGGGYAGAAFEPQQLITDYMIRVKGVRNPIACVNRAVGGTRVAQMNAIPDIDEAGGTTDVFWIKYGINDIQDGLEGFKNNLRAKLAEIRARPHGTVDQLSIILVGPNAIYDPQHFRSSQWMEQIRGIYVAAARDFKCAYFDAYGAMRDANWMPGTMLSDDWGNKQGVHPRSIFQNMIWGWLIDEMMGDAEMFPYSSNVWQALTPLNGWEYYGGSTPGYYASMSRDGWVSVRGTMKNGTVGANVKVAQLPASLTPVYTQIFPCGSASGPCLLRVNPDGSIDQADTNSSATYIDLSGIRFQIRG